MKILDSVLYRIFGGKITYSQCGEDIIIDHYFRSKGKNKISFLDIGANDPRICNNTFLFYKNGSSGVSIEPNIELYNKLSSNRPRDKNLNIGINFNNTPEMDFFVMDIHTLSTFNKIEAEYLEKSGQSKIAKTLKVKTQTINEIIKENFKVCPDLICIDVEGWNEEIVESIDFNICKPEMFLIETIFYSLDTNVKSEKISKIMIENGYKIYADTNLNTIFVRI